MERKRRHSKNEARKIQTLNKFNKDFYVALDIDNIELTINLIGTVLRNVVRRIGPAEAGQFVSQLPEQWQQLCLDEPAGPDRSITSESLIESVAVLMDYDYEEAEELLGFFWQELGNHISPGELAQVRAQLPKGMQRLFNLAGRPRSALELSATDASFVSYSR